MSPYSELAEMLKKGIVYTTGLGLFFLQASTADAEEQVAGQLEDRSNPDPDAQALRWVRAYLQTLDQIKADQAKYEAIPQPWLLTYWTGKEGVAGWVGWSGDIFNWFSLVDDTFEMAFTLSELAIWYSIPQRARELLSDEKLIEEAAGQLE
ncbi:MAG: hypothetical protein JSS02_18670 [Planctomycetes bacterium]|nr:hypothetical protein [Planctomycetota bacterium]